MSTTVTYQKTFQEREGWGGDARIQSLSSTQRALLILIDGRRTAETLAQILHQGEDIHQHLAVLLQAGLIEPASPKGPPAPSPSPMAQDLAAIKAQVDGVLTRHLGHQADPLRAELQGCSTFAELCHHTLNCRRRVAETAHQYQVEMFWQEAKQCFKIADR
ncbi:MAG: hypothetical protein ACFCBW_02630 [Candidatus Competibacterales bacterium]